MAVIYIHLDYEGFKSFEEQARAFRETTHKSTGGFYHKSLRLRVGPDLIIEFHGPLVGGYGHEEKKPVRFRKRLPAKDTRIGKQVVAFLKDHPASNAVQVGVHLAQNGYSKGSAATLLKRLADQGVVTVDKTEKSARYFWVVTTTG